MYPLLNYYYLLTMIKGETESILKLRIHPQKIEPITFGQSLIHLGCEYTHRFGWMNKYVGTNFLRLKIIVKNRNPELN
jgi:hypothetical protein